MNEGLFKKYTHQISSRDKAKQDILITIQERTGITLSESDITLSGKKVSLTTSSVKRTALLKKGIKDILSLFGYTLHN